MSGKGPTDGNATSLEQRLTNRAEKHLESLDMHKVKELCHEVATCTVSDIVGTVDALIARTFNSGKWHNMIEEAVTDFLRKDFDKVLALSADSYHFRKWEETQHEVRQLREILPKARANWELAAGRDRIQVNAELEPLRKGLQDMQEASSIHTARHREATTRLDSLEALSLQLQTESHQKVGLTEFEQHTSLMKREIHKQSTLLEAHKSEIPDSMKEHVAPVSEDLEGLQRAHEKLSAHCADVANRTESLQQALKVHADLASRFKGMSEVIQEMMEDFSKAQVADRELRQFVNAVAKRVDEGEVAADRMKNVNVRVDECRARVESMGRELRVSVVEGQSALSARIDKIRDEVIPSQDAAFRKEIAEANELSGLREEVASIATLMRGEAAANFKDRKLELWELVDAMCEVAAEMELKGPESAVVAKRLRLQQRLTGVRDLLTENDDGYGSGGGTPSRARRRLKEGNEDVLVPVLSPRAVHAPTSRPASRQSMRPPDILSAQERPVSAAASLGSAGQAGVSAPVATPALQVRPASEQSHTHSEPPPVPPHKDSEPPPVPVAIAITGAPPVDNHLVIVEPSPPTSSAKCAPPPIKVPETASLLPPVGRRNPEFQRSPRASSLVSPLAIRNERDCLLHLSDVRREELKKEREFYGRFSELRNHLGKLRLPECSGQQ